jgi:hypothetical protein
MAKSKTRSIQLDYRPHSYFWASERGIKLLSDIKGAERRRIYAQALAEGSIDELPAEIADESLSQAARRGFGGFHPTFMGGEYLPDHASQEVEIARITIASTTQDVTCVYARQVGGRIHYRVVDEYDGDTLSGQDTRTSNKPLTLKALVDFFLGSWDLMFCLDCNFREYAYPRDEVHGFIVDASSSFYPEFGNLISKRVDAWLDTVVEPEDEDEEETDEE